MRSNFFCMQCCDVLWADTQAANEKSVSVAFDVVEEEGEETRRSIYMLNSVREGRKVA